MGAIDKHLHVLDFTLSSFLRRRGKNGALILVYTLVVFLLASVMFFTQAVKREAAAVLRGAPEVVVQRMMAGRHDLLPAAHLEEIRGLRGVASVQGRLWGYYYDAVFGANYTLMVPADREVEPGTLVVGPGLVRSSMASVDNILPFRTYEGQLVSYVIADLLPGDAELVAADLILMAEQDFRDLFGFPEGLFTDAVVAVRNPAEVNTVAKKIAKLLPDTRPIVRDEILRTYETVFSWRGGILMFVLAGSLLAFVIFAWDKASGLSEAERREIAVLKAIGWETGDVILMKSWEGLAVSLTSFLLGAVLAYAHVFFGSSAFLAPVLKGWSVLYPDFRLVPHVDAYQLAALFFLCVVPYTVCTIVPTWRAATVDPDAVMKS
jgi:cell division protein FtsX